MKRGLLIIILLIICIPFAIGQKVKYKDLYPLLDAKRYDDAEPFLREFIKDEKNRDKYPNSLFQMALIYSEKGLSSDILTETEQFQLYADSAILQYQNALKQIDDKELRKNEEYYQAYKRRDIRTGEFGISLADIHFDIEKKIKALETRKKQVGDLKDYFDKSKSAYDTAFSLYDVVKKNYSSQKRLLLRLDQETTEKLNFIATSYDQSLENFKGYKNILEEVQGTDYNQELLIREINEMESEGSQQANFLEENIEIWNYNDWAEKVKKTHEEDVIPLFNQLITFDKQLNALQQKITSDSVSVTKEVPSLTSIEELDELKSFDSKPMPVALFNYRLERVKYDSHKMEKSGYKDSVNIDYQLSITRDFNQLLKNLDSLIVDLEGVDLKEESKNYNPFISSRYENGLSNYVAEEKQFVKGELDNVGSTLQELEEKSKWIISESDSIPIFKPESVSMVKYLPLLIDSLVTSGLYFSGEEPAKGYIADITPSRKATLYEYFDVDSETFNKANATNIKSESLVLLGDEKNVYFALLYAPIPESDNYSAIIVRANKDGILWANSINLTSEPGKLAYNVSTDEIIINYNVEDIEGVGGALVGNKVTISRWRY